jgi:ADP-heptose:LPS heptosyltransferase
VTSSIPKTSAPPCDPVAAVARVAVLRALPGLGDLLCVVPALRALRTAWPAADLTYIGLPRTEWFAERFSPYIDRFEPLRAWSGLPETADDPAEQEAFSSRMRARRFDIAFQLHGDGPVTNDLIATLGASRTAGLARPGAPRPDARTFPDVPDASEVERTLLPVRAAGVATDDRGLAWPESPFDVRGLFGLEPDTYAVLHAGASLPSRRWAPAGFARVADVLGGLGLEIVLTGVAAEAAITRRVAASTRAPTVDLAGALDLGGAAALIRRARLVVTNDTGVSHLAAAVGTPSVVVFTVTDPGRWKPEAAIHVAVRAGPGLEATVARVAEVALTLAA